MISYVIFDMFETLVTFFNGPNYFGSDMARDLSIPIEEFRGPWHDSEQDRTLGRKTLSQCIRELMKQFGKTSEEDYQKVIEKRIAYKQYSFDTMKPEILTMLQGLKEAGIKIGLVSNCFSEEAEIIRESSLFPFFDAPIMSYEVGISKPDPAIFRLCMERLAEGKQRRTDGVTAASKFVPDPSEFLYIGDGGSLELETAASLSMQAAQACWYLKEGTYQPVGRKPEFLGFNTPMEVVEYVRKVNCQGE